MMQSVRMSILPIVFGGAILLCAGIGLQRNSSSGLLDFKALYFGSQCLMHGCDPYNTAELAQFFREQGGERTSDPVVIRQVVTQYVNLPTAFVVTMWFGLLGWTAAHIAWTAVTTTLFLLASILIWSCCNESSPWIGGWLIGFLVGNSLVLVAGGNAAGIAISLCVIGAWCFLQEKFVRMGILAMGISLLIKPHDSGLVWLFFLLARGSYRRRALEALAVAVSLGGPAIAWVSYSAPHWLREWQTNIAALSVHGGFNDPGPSSYVAGTAGDIIDLQAVISLFRDDPRVYNSISYAVSGMLFLLVAFTALRRPATREQMWIGLAAVSAITMLVTYHKPVDARLLLLGIPACAVLCTRGGLTRIFAVVFTTAALTLTSDIPLALLTQWKPRFDATSSNYVGRVVGAALMRPAPIALLAMAMFCVCALGFEFRSSSAAPS